MQFILYKTIISLNVYILSSHKILFTIIITTKYYETL